MRRPQFALPLLTKELAELAGRRRTYVLRSVFAFLLAFIFWIALDDLMGRSAREPLAILGAGRALLDYSYVSEWCLLCLVVPATVSGAIVSEKERNTLSLLFLTRLGPWTILFEKLLSRMVPIVTFLLMSLPILGIAYSIGGIGKNDLMLAGMSLLVMVFELGSIAIFCSAWCQTTTGAIVQSYVLVMACFAGPPFAVLFMARMVASTFGEEAYLAIYRATSWLLAMNVDWFLPRYGPMSVLLQRPFPRDPRLLIGPVAISVFFLMAARYAIVRRAAVQPTYRLRRFFRTLDRDFEQLNDRFAAGVLLSRDRGDLALEHPVAWRESRRGNLGRWNYLLRIALAIEIPLWLLITGVFLLFRTNDQPLLSASVVILWIMAVIAVSVRSAGLVAAERTRQTLDVLLTTPLRLREIAGEKLVAMRRVMVVMALPVLTTAAWQLWWSGDLTGQLWPPSIEIRRGDPNYPVSVYLACIALAMLIHLPLAARLGFRMGLRARNHARAVIRTFVWLAVWVAAPPFVDVLYQQLLSRDSLRQLDWITGLSPLALLVANERHHNFVRPASPWKMIVIHYLFCLFLYGLLVIKSRRAAEAALVRPRGEIACRLPSQVSPASSRRFVRFAFSPNSDSLSDAHPREAAQ